MEEEMVSLRWNNHLTILSQLLYSLREEEQLIDVTLACDGKLFSAHKFVLSMCSDYFKEMFISNPCKHPIVFMKDVRGDDMEALLDFVYHGIVHIPQDNLSSLLKTAEGLQIRGLGVFARESATATDNINVTNDRNSMVSTAGLDTSNIMSPERKRTYELDHDGNPLIGFSDGDLDDGPMHHIPSGSASNSGPIKKIPKMEHHNPPAPIPELPKVGEDMLDMGGGVSISATDYYRFRRTNANRYINDLLRYFFPLEVLASSSLTGGECFANKERGPSNKNQLDPVLIRVITHDAIRNFPTITEKQVRNAIRRKLNTESRIYRGLIRPGNQNRRSTGRPRKPRFSISPRAQISIEKSDRDKKQGPIMGSMATPNVTVEKAPSKDARRASYASPGHSQNMMDKNEKREEEITYFRPKAPTPTQYPQDQQTPPTHQSVTPSNSATPTPTPISTPTLPPSSGSSPATATDKTFSMVKSEIPTTAQYLPQEYSYAGVMPSHVTQAYLPHPMATSDPTYLRRLEMTQGGPHPPITSYYHTSLPTSSEAMEQNLHM